MLEFCETVSPNLDNYEADGVSSSFCACSCEADANPAGMADALGRVRRAREGAAGE